MQNTTCWCVYVRHWVELIGETFSDSVIDSVHISQWNIWIWTIKLSAGGRGLRRHSGESLPLSHRLPPSKVFVSVFCFFQKAAQVSFQEETNIEPPCQRTPLLHCCYLRAANCLGDANQAIFSTTLAESFWLSCCYCVFF